MILKNAVALSCGIKPSDIDFNMINVKYRRRSLNIRSIVSSLTLY
ncbi:hypothetical protein P689_11974 [Candidatus Riesia pediculischaeffi PTSU]|uniref:Uncharacterized protein n=1 Tax=Candidatus Riesia pediculischaeffi PTSU TaxID=1401651 RepID=A0A0C1V8C0_9ENTR|nr:hypothetical protein P689_11974 [Candidatus Riesia pediculischaeffi PTSU]